MKKLANFLERISFAETRWYSSRNGNRFHKSLYRSDFWRRGSGCSSRIRFDDYANAPSCASRSQKTGACARTSINIYWCKTSRLNNNKWSLYFAPSDSPPPALFLRFLLLSALACARASMYVFIDVTRDSRTQLTARKHRMHRGYTSVFRVRLWHPLSGAECRSRFLYDINPRSAMHLTHEDRACGITWPRILRTNSPGNDDKAA